MTINKKSKLAVYIISVLVSIFIIFATYNIFIKNTDLTIYGIINDADGIGRQPIDLINMLDEEKIDINFIGEVHSKRNLNQNIRAVLKNYNFKIGRVFINEEPLLHLANHKYKFQRSIYKKLAKINPLHRSEQIWLAYSMFESDKITKAWVYELNINYDAVVVPDKVFVKIYEDSGVKIPIFVVPLSVDFSNQLKQPLKTEANQIFTFGNLSTIENRKNIFTLLEAFKKAFGNRKDVRLILNARRAEEKYGKKIYEYIINHNMTNVDYNIMTKDAGLYNYIFDHIDCYVSLSKGEGFSVQPREAMARGIPVIVSDSLAQKTIADSGLVRVVPANTLKVATYFDDSAIIGNNYDVELTDTVAAMKDVYNNYQKYLNLSAKAREWVSQYNYENIRLLYVNLVKPKKVIFGKENKVTKDYIETNSEKLYNKYINNIK